ncbi:copper resistance protein CopD [Herminiimonas sp. KBW02]|uniref:copper homeostasis membrane protein CopD n=1 Tax=Herminiimonas sp. KBW02 TaxID=2153363 RepID=UPI000F5AD3B6|nr:copper homeostasis membrane protein CopD [Herminiimonas sp. KBW02]RQO35795.1 copper resistance protein CopD [Herminiimonas sp. KBW02]
MADDGLNIALRFGLYVSMAALFGVAVFGLYALRLTEKFAYFERQYVIFTATVSVLSLILSVASMLVLAKAMSGAESYSELTIHLLGMVITGTDMGLAWVLRMVALLACVIVVASSGARFHYGLLAAFSAVALATLAWSGHAAMNDGVQGTLHLVSDIAHLFAAGAWVGALFSFVMLALMKPSLYPDAPTVLSKTANGFAQFGTVIVVTLMSTGIANYLLIIGPSIKGLVATQYGMLLSVKLALFTGMLALATANRFFLGPRVEQAMQAGKHEEAVSLLRRSLLTETALVVLVIACVAWLGVLAPTQRSLA